MSGISASAYIHGALATASFLPSLLGSAASFADSIAYFAEGDRINGGIALGAAALGLASDAGLVRLGLKGGQVGVDALRGTLAANKAVGRAAEVRAAGDLVAEGNTILGSQVSVRTSESRRVLDHLIQTPNGQIVACEVKCGGAVRNGSQLAKDGAMATEGGVVIGKNAPDALRGQQIVIPTIELRY